MFDDKKNQKQIAKPVFTYINTNNKIEKQQFNMWLNMLKKIQTISINL